MNLNGILIIDKPADWTSHDVVAKLRGALRIKCIGHGGTLDPMATGVLPIFIGTATRQANSSTDADKEYIAGLKLGVVTDTQDITGNVLRESEVSVTQDDINAILPNFTGPQKQIPPMYSAKRQNGKKLYELARKGIEVEREPRDITIKVLELLKHVTGGRNPCEGEGFVNSHVLRVKCSKGTYVRTLCHDIGAALGCGGTMSSLRRTMSGVYNIQNAHTLDDVLGAISNGEIEKLMFEVYQNG
ncbi:MAG: tRNA pseudouridine(55) synthase TruB [Oscillospiraceae bacterium]|nr:tRNA pseudouridine(55) synthase TruB [Oscillospiraceae bacterium]